MVGTSFLSGADIAVINQAIADGFATELAIDPYELALFRFNPSTGHYEQRSVQTVVKTLHDQRQGRDEQSATAESYVVTGQFEKDLPFDIALGDRFDLAPGQMGVIVRLSEPANGTQVAEWIADEGHA